MVPIRWRRATPAVPVDLKALLRVRGRTCQCRAGAPSASSAPGSAPLAPGSAPLAPGSALLAPGSAPLAPESALLAPEPQPQGRQHVGIVIGPRPLGPGRQRVRVPPLQHRRERGRVAGKE